MSDYFERDGRTPEQRLAGAKRALAEREDNWKKYHVKHNWGSKAISTISQRVEVDYWAEYVRRSNLTDKQREKEDAKRAVTQAKNNLEASQAAYTATKVQLAKVSK